MRVPRPMMRMLARGKPFVPDAMWPMLNTVASSLGSGPLVGTPPLRRVLALCAHPDDEAIGCAGTLALLASSGAAVQVVYATRGDATRGSALPPDEIGRRRAAEAGRACEILGLPQPRFLTFTDGTLAGQVEAMAGAIAPIVEEFKPDAIFVPWFLDGHSDHRAMSEAVARLDSPSGGSASGGAASGFEVWAFEWWSALPPNRVVDITSVYSKKEACVAAHETAHLAFDVSAALALSRWRSLHGLHGQGYAEAFLVAPHSEYRRLVERVAMK